MSSVARQLLEQCLALPDDERRRLAHELLDSVTTLDPGWEAAWAEEVALRSRTADEDGDSGRPWHEIKAELLARHASR